MVHHARVDRWVAVLLGGGFLLQVAARATLIGAGLLSYALISAAAGALLGLLLCASYRTRHEVESVAPHHPPWLPHHAGGGQRHGRSPHTRPHARARAFSGQ